MKRPTFSIWVCAAAVVAMTWQPSGLVSASDTSPTTWQSHLAKGQTLLHITDIDVMERAAQHKAPFPQTTPDELKNGRAELEKDGVPHRGRKERDPVARKRWPTIDQEQANEGRKHHQRARRQGRREADKDTVAR